MFYSYTFLLITTISLAISFLGIRVLRYGFEEKEKGMTVIGNMLVIISLCIVIAGGIFVYNKIYAVENCPNCNYQYQLYEDYNYCPQCGAKLKNKCDNCDAKLPDNVDNICPFCGEKIKVKVGDIPIEVN